MDFWDHLTLVTLITIRDYYHDKEKQKQKIGKIYEKCKEEIACAASDLFNAITEVSEKANPNCIPNEIGTGSIILPVYAFAKVLQAQGGIPSLEQKSFLDIYFKNMSVGFSENEFLASMHSNNDTQHKMNALVGISENSAGTFWIAFFKAMYVTKSDESTLSKVADYFSSIVVRFSILGKTQNQAALPICESFIKAIHMQIIECRKLPENDLDFIGEVPYLEHKQRITNIAMSLLYAAGEQDGLDLDQMLPIFYISMLYDMVSGRDYMSELNYQSLNDCHESGLLNIWADADVIRYTNMRLPCTLEDIRKRIVIFRSMGVFAVMHDGRLIGIIGCPPVDKEKLQFGLFYQFCKSSWGHGNATAAAKWMLKYMKQKYVNPVLFADVVVDNAGSEKILQKFCFEKISEELIERDGIKLKVHNYKLCV